MSDAILPCPFCSGTATLFPPTCNRSTPYDPADRAFPQVRCGGCHVSASGNNWDERGASAIKAWNTRASAPVPVVVAEEAVERAAKAHWDAENAAPWNKVLGQGDWNPGLSEAQREHRRGYMRAALLASGLGDGAGWVLTADHPPKDCVDVDAVWWGGDRKMAHLRGDEWWYFGNMGIKKATVPPKWHRELPPAPVSTMASLDRIPSPPAAGG